jgi:mRNA-degrading endonuclease toxin of MazEF toxin-antitoxin module
MPRYEKGDILLADFGSPPKEVMGHEQGLVRPCVVLACFDYFQVVLCAPCTTQAKTMGYPGVLKLEASPGGMNKDGYVLLPHARSISFDRVIGKVKGSLRTEDMDRIDEAMSDLLGH